CLTDSRVLTKTAVSGGYSFTLSRVQVDSLVVLTGAERMYYIHDDLHGVNITDYTSPAKGSLFLRLSLPAGSQYNSIDASVWMGGTNVTGNVLSGRTISIDNLTGDVYIFAYATQVDEDSFPWWIVAAIAAAALIILLLLLLLLRKKKEVFLSSSDTSYIPLLSQDMGGKTRQVVIIRKDEEIAPAYAYLRIGKDSYMRMGYWFEGADLPEGLYLSETGVLTGTYAGTAPSGVFRITVKKKSEKEGEQEDPEKGTVVATGEFGYVLS
ncbi:MAG: hypothetical protein J5494_09355, partial [Candidatus Methanomethylophilaceae archaeon]|nr:hypothetical protein [Candidatus Methanomethylophilaceae archaeon]